MRPIKFRVFNGEQMVSPDYIDREGCAHWKENSIPQSSNALMQFTGIYDKRDKPIYESDIVSGCSFNGSYCYGIVSQCSVGWKVYPIKRVEGCDDIDRNGIEVIGNVYSDQDLLL